MKGLQKLTFYYVTPLLCGLSLSATSLDAQSCCPEPCGPDWCSIIVPILAGAAAGAGVAAAVDHRGKRGKKGRPGHPGTNGLNGADGADGQDGERGRRGPRGERGEHGRRGPRGHQGEPGDPWVADVGRTVTFEWCLSGPTGVTGDIIPFLETPDGHVYEAEHFNFFGATATQCTALTINNPIYGTYHFGYLFPPSGGATGINSYVSAEEVETSRDHTETTYSIVPAGFTLDPTFEQQVTGDFTYFLDPDD